MWVGAGSAWLRAGLGTAVQPGVASWLARRFSPQIMEAEAGCARLSRLSFAGGVLLGAVLPGGPKMSPLLAVILMRARVRSARCQPRQPGADLGDQV